MIDEPAYPTLVHDALACLRAVHHASTRLQGAGLEARSAPRTSLLCWHGPCRGWVAYFPTITSVYAAVIW